MPGFLAPFVVGLISAPVINRVVKPLARAGVKATIGLAFEMRKLVEETTEELQDIAAEVSAQSQAGDPDAQVRTAGATGASPEEPLVGGQQSAPPAGRPSGRMPSADGM